MESPQESVEEAMVKRKPSYRYFRVRVPNIEGIATAFWKEYIEDAVRTWYGGHLPPADYDEFDEHRAMAGEMDSVKVTSIATVRQRPRTMQLGDITWPTVELPEYVQMIDTDRRLQRSASDQRF